MTELEVAANYLEWIKLGKTIGAFLVAIGVAAEFLGDFIAKPYEDKVEAARQAELAELHRQAEDAKLETARLSTEATAARSSIAEANARAAEVQLAHEKFRAPRILNPQQQKELRDRLTPFPGTKVRSRVSCPRTTGKTHWIGCGIAWNLFSPEIPYAVRQRAGEKYMLVTGAKTPIGTQDGCMMP